MLTKMIDGITVICTDAEEASIRASWAFHENYGQYDESMTWDERYTGAVLDANGNAQYDLSTAKTIHAFLLTNATSQLLAQLNEQIELARENDDTATEKTLMAQRKTARAYPSMDLSGCNSIDDLLSSVPSDLISLWG